MKTYREFVGMVSEKYTKPNTRLLRYLLSKEFYLDNVAFLIKDWAYQNGHDEFDSIDEDDYDLLVQTMETNPELDDFKEYAIDWLLRHDPSEAPSHAYLDVMQDKLLPRTTWLVHFSDDADDIWKDGFVYGHGDISTLGLTTYHHDRKTSDGFNFAFDANSRDAAFAARQTTYGDKAVIFQNSGVIAAHSGDEEYQVMFWGPDVSPKDMVHIYEEGGDWHVRANQYWNEPSDRQSLYHGTFEDVVKWVQTNHHQYRKILSYK